MDYQLNWTLRARSDLREIVSHIAQDDSGAALAWGEGLFRHVEVLTTFPLIGPAVPATTAPLTRRIVLGDYLVFYRVNVESKRVDLIAIWHGARGLPEHL